MPIFNPGIQPFNVISNHGRRIFKYSKILQSSVSKAVSKYTHTFSQFAETLILRGAGKKLIVVSYFVKSIFGVISGRNKIKL